MAASAAALVGCGGEAVPDPFLPQEEQTSSQLKGFPRSSNEQEALESRSMANIFLAHLLIQIMITPRQHIGCLLHLSNRTSTPHLLMWLATP